MKKNILSILLIVSLITFGTSTYANSHYTKTIEFDLSGTSDHFVFYFTPQDIQGNDDLILSFNIFDSSTDVSLIYVLVDITDPNNLKYISTGSGIKSSKTIVEYDAFKDYQPSDNAVFQLGVANNGNDAQGKVTIQVY